MSQNGYSLGADITLHFNTQNGPVSLGTGITHFESKQDTDHNRKLLINGKAINFVFQAGHSGSIELMRQDSSLDDYFANLETQYYLGANLPMGSITQTINEPDGTVSQWLYTGVVFQMETAGAWSGNSEVNQKVTFFAQRKQRVS